MRTFLFIFQVLNIRRGYPTMKSVASEKLPKDSVFKVHNPFFFCSFFIFFYNSCQVCFTLCPSFLNCVHHCKGYLIKPHYAPGLCFHTVLSGKVLYHQDGGTLRRVIESEEEKKEVLTEAHAGHFGARRMQVKINQRFFWRGIIQDTLDWVSNPFFIILQIEYSQ